MYLGAPRCRDIAVEAQTTTRRALTQQIWQAGLEKRCMPGGKRIDTSSIGFDADDVMAERSHTCRVDRTQIAAADNRNSHGSDPSSSLTATVGTGCLAHRRSGIVATAIPGGALN